MTAPSDAPTTINAAFRDASWLVNPDTRSPKKAHVLLANGDPACGLKAMMCDPQPAELISTLSRCQRPGCKAAWPE